MKMVRVCGLLWKIFFHCFIQSQETFYLVLGECAPTERQIPDKLYRAALLKNRFADTILKAREKTLAHVSHITCFEPT